MAWRGMDAAATRRSGVADSSRLFAYLCCCVLHAWARAWWL